MNVFLLIYHWAVGSSVCRRSGVSLVCKFPTKRFMEFGQLSGGEQHLAGLSLALALSSFNPVSCDGSLIRHSLLSVSVHFIFALRACSFTRVPYGPLWKCNENRQTSTRQPYS